MIPSLTRVLVVGMAVLVAAVALLLEFDQPLRVMEIGVGLSVLVTTVIAYGQFKVASTHIGLVLMVLGGWMYGVGSTPLDRPVLVFLCAMALSTILSPRSARFGIFPRPWRGDGLITSMAFGATALAAARLPAFDRTVFLILCVGCGFVAAIIALAQAQGFEWARILGGARQKPDADGAWGTMGNPVMLAGTMCLLIPVALDFGLWGWLPAQVMTIALFVSRCRAAILGIVSASVAMIGTMPWSVFAPVYSGVGIGALWGQRTFERMSQYQVQASTVDRTYLWGYLAAKIVRRPLIGWGLNSIAVTLPLDDPRRAKEKHETAHNELFEIAHNGGLFGLAAYLWVWVTALHHAQFNGVTIGLVAFAVWLIFTWTTVGPGNLCYLFLGLMVANR